MQQVPPPQTRDVELPFFEWLERVRTVRILIALAICLSFAALGWPFINNSVHALEFLHAQYSNPAPRQLIAALLPAVAGLYLWCISVAFLLFALIKLRVPNKEQHLTKFIFVQRLGQGFLWLTAGVAIVWLMANLCIRS